MFLIYSDLYFYPMYHADLNAFSQSAVMIHGDWHTTMVADIDGWGNADELTARSHCLSRRRYAV